MVNPEHFLVCPECDTPVAEATAETRVELLCPKGHGPWPVENGTPWFTSEASEFEGRWSETYPLWKKEGLLKGIVSRNTHWGIPRLFGSLLGQIGGRPLDILDIGCGGGWAFLGCYGKVTGIDTSPTALRAAAQVYDRTVRACASSRLPFAAGSFDVVTSIWLAEHLGEAEFTRFLHEARRVLKPEGHFIFLADLHSSKPILRWARSYPAEYQKYHIDRVGHHGLRSLSYTRHLLREAGYVEHETIAINKSSLLQPVTALWMFDNSLGRKSMLLKLYVRFCRLTLKSHRLHRVIYALLMEYHRLLDRHLPDSYAFSAVFDWKPKIQHDKQSLPTVESSPFVSHPDQQGDLAGSLSHPIIRSRRPVAVVVDNVAQAFPQVGLAQATTVFQVPVEGLQTRLLAIYSDDLPTCVGPVRSARPYSMALAGAYQPFFIHCGASPEARILLQNPDNLIGIELRYRLEEGMPGPLSVANAEVTRFDLSRKSPHFVFAMPGTVFQNPEGLSVSMPMSFRSGGTPRLSDLVDCECEARRSRYPSANHQRGSEIARCVEVRLQPKAHSGERFIWDASAAGFRRAALARNRSIDGSQIDDLVIRNLIIVETHVESIPNDARGRLRVQACGTGPGYLWCGGPRIDVTWRKPSPDQPMQFFDEKDKEVVLCPGLTWICILGPGGELRVR